MTPIKFRTWNVRSLNSPAKRVKIISHLSKLKGDICLLQEMHLINSNLDQLKTKSINQVYAASYNSKKRGVD